MRLFSKFLFFFTIFFTFAGSAADIQKFYNDYIIEVGKIDLGKLSLEIDLEQENYQIKINMEDRGLISGLYKFSGNYYSYGIIKDNIFFPSYYKQNWKTKKKSRKIEMIFKNQSIEKLIIHPKEDEKARVDFKKIKNYLDPLSSFLNILLGSKISKTIDGRRIYSMAVDNNYEDRIKIFIKDYINIWADHKKNDLKSIEVYLGGDKKKFELPDAIKINFKGVVFNLSKI